MQHTPSPCTHEEGGRRREVAPPGVEGADVSPREGGSSSCCCSSSSTCRRLLLEERTSEPPQHRGQGARRLQQMLPVRRDDIHDEDDPSGGVESRSPRGGDNVVVSDWLEEELLDCWPPPA